MAERPTQGMPVGFFQCTGHVRLFLDFLERTFGGQQVAAQYRGQGQGDDSGSKQGDYKRDAQRNQHAPFHARQEKQRQEAGDDNQCGVQDRHTHFLGCLKYQLQKRNAFFLGLQAVFPQPFIYILHIHNGVIHQ